MEMDKILKAIQESGYIKYGVRSDDMDFEVGKELRPSYEWDYENDMPSTEFLDGTCATAIGYLWFDGEEEDRETLKAAIEFNRSCCYGKNMYIIAGDECEEGADPNEIVIKDAVVICIL